ncbi:hypothetical protein BGZ68_005044 [Mortierella alpina]|nr:hypothetical protein BGZ68_005044 [Mortierella alpina]
MTNEIKLNCLVAGESTLRAFPVKLLSDDSVGDLKELIKAKKEHAFSDLDADTLTLWHVSIPDANDDYPVPFDSVPEKTKLKATIRLSRVFEIEPPEDTIHIIVQRPTPGNRFFDVASDFIKLRRSKVEAHKRAMFNAEVWSSTLIEPSASATTRPESIPVEAADIRTYFSTFCDDILVPMFKGELGVPFLEQASTVFSIILMSCLLASVQDRSTINIVEIVFTYLSPLVVFYIKMITSVWRRIELLPTEAE